MKPLAVDLCCGLGGWTHGLLAEGWDVIGYDIERHEYGGEKYPAQLVIQDIMTLDGRQFRGKVSLITASPPCTEFSYMAMPWRRGKQIQAALLGKGEFPADYKGSRTIKDLTALFDACVRIGREAECPIVIENVRGAQRWVGKAQWNFGSFYLFGDVPALMPIPQKAHKVPGFRFDGTRVAGNQIRRINEAHRSKSPAKGYGAVTEDGIKHGGDCFNDPSWPGKQGGVKQSGISGARSNGKGDKWFQDEHGSKSNARKAASAMIAKIPAPLASWIAKAMKPKI